MIIRAFYIIITSPCFLWLSTGGPGDGLARPVAAESNAEDGASRIVALLGKSSTGDKQESLNEQGDLSVLLFAKYKLQLQDDYQKRRQDRDSQSRFLGYVEGILGAAPPDRWVKALYNHNDRPKFGYFVNDPQIFQDLNSRVRIPKHLHISETEKKIVYTNKDKIEFDLTAPIVKIRKVSNASFEYLNLSEDSLQIYIATYSGNGSAYGIGAISKKSSKIVWTASVWAIGTMGSTGSPMQYVDIKVGKDSIVVYGCCLGHLYVESFSKLDGTPVARFSTNLWGYGDW